MTTVFGSGTDHEQVVFCQDPASGLRAIIAIYSTALGPALGGTRFRAYPDEDAALADALALSQAMAYKAACAGLDLGGGKAVIVGDPAELRSEPLLRAFGRFIAALGGRYITACDMGTYESDMNIIGRETTWVTGRSTDHGGSGDSGILTAFGVYQGMRACAARLWGAPSLAGRRVGVIGTGKVGRRLISHLLADGATVLAADVSAPALDALRVAYADRVTIVDDPDELATADIDVYAPCAVGGVLTAELARMMSARVVCGGANNQLAEPSVGDDLAAAGVLYAPDFVVNAGGLIQLADEIDGYRPERARANVARIFDTTASVLALAEREGLTTARAADETAEQRMANISRLRKLLVR